VTAPAMTPCCRNLFCFGCICETLKRRPICPLCRETIQDIQSVQVIGDKQSLEPVEPIVRPQTKQETFRAFLQDHPNARVLMFSGYDATFTDLSSVLETDGISHATLAGSNARISRLLKDFEAGKYRVLFLNARNMGAGLNIKPATHVVLYHRMAIETQNQIIGRAVRLGRTEPLTVVHFLHGNEMEQVKMQELEEGHRIEHV
jgi:SNF2 family DNA or RNA helicase